MNSREPGLLQRPAAKTALRLDPKILLGSNLLFVPLEGLTEECAKILGDNPFFYFAPPGWQSRDADIDELDPDSVPAPKSIEEHLSLQVATCPRVSDLAPPFSSAAFWCSFLDEKGYLNTSVAEIAAEMGTSAEAAAECIKSLQDYVEPLGLFASDLRSSLLIQLERSGLAGSLPWKMLTYGHIYLEERRFSELSRMMGCGEEDLNEALNLLRKLDPSPGKNFHTIRPAYPEIEFIIESGRPYPKLILENLPRICISVSDMSVSEEGILCQKWMRPFWSRARTALTRLGMRYRTLLKISFVIAEVQSGFLRGETDAVSPLTYETAAKRLSLSVSTVHRAVDDTWCRHLGRTIRMKTFFSRGASSRPDLSVKELRSAILELNMSGKNDREIGEILAIPTRTINYHRAKMSLPAKR